MLAGSVCFGGKDEVVLMYRRRLALLWTRRRLAGSVTGAAGRKDEGRVAGGGEVLEGLRGGPWLWRERGENCISVAV